MTDLGGEDACFAHLLAEDGTLDERSASFVLRPAPPYRLDLTAWALRRRADNVVDRWDADDGAYRRVFVVDGAPIDVEVRQRGPVDEPELLVTARASTRPPLAVQTQVARTLVRSLGLEVDLTGFYELADDDPFLGPLTARFRGVRPPRFHTWTEALTAAVSCQQLSLAVGIQLLNRLAIRYGLVGTDGSPAFPTAEDLAVADPDELRAMGYSNRKAQVITNLAGMVHDGTLDLDRLETAPDDEVADALCRLHGIGRWSAEYVILRGLGRVRVFPGDDVGAQNRLGRLLGTGSRLDRDGVQELMDRWDPWAGLVYFHLLLDGLADAGYVEPTVD